MPVNNDPPLMLTILEKGIYTDELVQISRDFVINVMGEPMAEKVLACGRSKGRETNKFAKVGLTAMSSKQVRPPYLKESLAHIECKVTSQHPHGTVTIYVGQVVYTEVEQEVWDGKSLIIEKAKTIHHMTGGTFAITERSITVQKPKI